MQFRRWISALVLLSPIVCGGCQLFQAQGDPLSAYEDTRRRIDRRAVARSSGIRPVSHEESAPDKPKAREEKPHRSKPKKHSSGPKDAAASSLTDKLMQVIGQGPSEKKARQLYEEGDRLYREANAAEGKERREKFASAAGKFAAAAERWPNSRSEEDALFHEGESWFFSDYYSRARIAFDKLIKKYPSTKYLEVVDARRFALARYWIGLHRADPHWPITPNFIDRRRPRTDTFGNALKVLDRIRLDDPTGDLADDATMAAANAQFAAGKYAEADELYTDLRENFSDSPHQFQAHLLGVKCKLELYAGPDYEDKPLDEAEELIRRIYKLFPRQAQQHGEVIEKAYKQVRFQKALCRWNRAQYYERRGEFGGARYNYAILVKEFPKTSFAEKAKERLAATADRPDRPVNRFRWLTDLFETDNKNEPLIANGRLNMHWK